MRIEPPVSLPIEPMHKPAANADPLPPEEPPGDRSKSQGLRQGPKCGLLLVTPRAISCMLSFPRLTAPAASKRSTTTPFSSGILSLKNRDPAVVVMPLVSKRSFNAIGMPCSGPRTSPLWISTSASLARSSASSGVWVMKQFSPGSSLEIRSRWA